MASQTQRDKEAAQAAADAAQAEDEFDVNDGEINNDDEAQDSLAPTIHRTDEVISLVFG